MKNNYFVINNSTDPFYNLALEEHLLTNTSEGIIVMLWQNDNAVVIGRNQNVFEEVNVQYAKENGITIVRRSTGGGAVYHDLGNFNYSIITSKQVVDDDSMKILSEPIINVLKELGIDAEFTGRNDIVVSGKKISGTAQRIYGDRVLHHGCILFDSNLETLAKCFNVNSKTITSKAVKSVKSRVTNIKEHMKVSVTIEQFKEFLAQEIMKNEQYTVLNITKDMHEATKKLAADKYRTKEWNYNLPMKYTLHKCKRYDGGILDIYMDIQNGRIMKCQIYGDFLSRISVSSMERALEGCPYAEQSVRELLGGFVLEEYFGCISVEEILGCIFMDEY